MNSVNLFKNTLALIFLGFVLGLLVSQGFTDLSYKPFIKGADYVF